MDCRSGCGACCIAPSISSPIPGMPGGKPAGVRCVQLTGALRCALFGDPRRPKVCASLQANVEMCGAEDGAPGREHALEFLGGLELATRP
ncbi:MAG: YkgJ family cysteine cluster protein [Nevskia sp.]|nr:YkgJ family cysteine cluster protein [Nevskia sp.]